MNKQQKRVTKVLKNMIEMVKKDEHYTDAFSHMLQDSLEDLNMQDGFGTEGQCDPRGYFRDNTWTMWLVEGLDK